jgi:hypothetical protein
MRVPAKSTSCPVQRTWTLVSEAELESPTLSQGSCPCRWTRCRGYEPWSREFDSLWGLLPCPMDTDSGFLNLMSGFDSHTGLAGTPPDGGLGLITRGLATANGEVRLLSPATNVDTRRCETSAHTRDRRVRLSHPRYARQSTGWCSRPYKPEEQGSSPWSRKMLGWRNWQPRRLQEPVAARSCEFDSRSEHEHEWRNLVAAPA